MTNSSVVKSKKGKVKTPYDPNEYPERVNTFVSTTKVTCEHLGGIFQNAWMGEIHIQLDYIFDRSIATNVTEPTPSTTVKSNTRETKLSHVTINQPKDKSQVTAIHLQGIAAKDDPAYQPLKDAIDQLRAQITVTSPTLRAVKISAIKQPDYNPCEQVKSLLMGAGATDVTLANVEHNIAYGVKLEGKYNDTSFCVLVYHQFSGSLNQNPETRSAVWE